MKDRANFGEWLNVQWDASAAVGVFAASPHAQVGAERRNGYRLMRADALRSVKLRGVAALSHTGTRAAAAAQASPLARTAPKQFWNSEVFAIAKQI